MSVFDFMSYGLSTGNGGMFLTDQQIFFLRRASRSSARHGPVHFKGFDGDIERLGRLLRCDIRSSRTSLKASLHLGGSDSMARFISRTVSAEMQSSSGVVLVQGEKVQRHFVQIDGGQVAFPR